MVRLLGHTMLGSWLSGGRCLLPRRFSLVPWLEFLDQGQAQHTHFFFFFFIILRAFSTAR